MIKDFAKRVDHDIPEHLKKMVMGIITGETKKPVKLYGQPMYATGFPLLVYSHGTIPQFIVNNTHLKPESKLNVAGQIGNVPVTFSLDGILGLVGLVLHPLATYYLFHKPGIYFLNTWKSLESESPLDSFTLDEKLTQHDDISQRVKLLMDFISRLNQNRLPAIEWLNLAIAKILETGGMIEQSVLANQSGISLRHFRRVFKKVVGLSPKYYCKVIQINTIFELLNSSATEKLHHLALDCGYYDQSHFIRDFHKFIGTSPDNFLNGRHAYLKTYLGRHL